MESHKVPRRKRKFIDKKKSVTFQLVHRSQKDPLAADEDAPQRVLLPYAGKQDFPDSVSQTNLDDHWSEMRKYGIDFDDDYDYMQHLREPSQKQIAVLEPKEFGQNIMVGDEDEDGMTEVIRDDQPVIKLPSVLFGSRVEEPIGMLHRAIPPVGPQLEWDPDIVAGLEVDFDYDNPENQLEDDFIAKACAPCEDDDGPHDVTSDASDSVASDVIDDYSYDDEHEETKSRFTNYSMTSSVIRRNDQLSLLDDKFERFFEAYEEANIGGLEQVDIEGVFPLEDMACALEEGMAKYMSGQRSSAKDDLEEKPIVNTDKYAYITDDVGDEASDDNKEVLVKEDREKAWDCETILSTYSNLYNHPKVIEEPVKKVKVSEKTGIPLSDDVKLTMQQLISFNVEDEKRNAPPPTRRKGESKEEKSERKRTVKEAKKERRQEKKATKLAFKHERSRQSKELLNIQQNLQGIKIS